MASQYPSTTRPTSSGSSFFLPRAVGSLKAFELSTLGSKVTAEEALRLGLVNQVVAPDALNAAVAELAARYAAGPTKAIGLMKKMLNKSFNSTLDEMLERCHGAGQVRPTPLLLTYGPGDYNCLHQDLYGEHVFPLQAAVLLDEPGRDFTGGEFVLVEQRPRQQSRAQVVPLSQGEAVIFAVRERPAEGSRGVHRRQLRHGVSTLRSGRRRTLGIIFHDAL